jgi:hypothetical protein
MIFRLSQKLAKMLKSPKPGAAPADPNPLADWSAHLFTADRTQYLLLTNTPSLYSIVIDGRGISDDSLFLDRALTSMREFMVADGLELIFREQIVSASGTVRFASALNRSVTGAMNDLVYHAQLWILERGLSPFDACWKLNEMPMSRLNYRYPREAFQALADARSE